MTESASMRPGGWATPASRGKGAPRAPEIWRRRVLEPVRALLRQGLTPEGIALSLAVGLAAGIFPVIGATTLVALATGALLQLNQPAVQIANWLAYPLQLLLILPFVRLGEWLAGAPPLGLDVPLIVDRVTADPAAAVAAFGMTGLHGILGWVAVLPLVVPGVFYFLRPVLRTASLRVGPGVRLSS